MLVVIMKLQVVQIIIQEVKNIRKITRIWILVKMTKIIFFQMRRI